MISIINGASSVAWATGQPKIFCLNQEIIDIKVGE